MSNFPYIAAPVLGILCIAAALYGWIAYRLFGLGGIAFSLIGVVLLGFPVWQKIAVDIGGAHITLVKNQEALNSCVKQADAVLNETKNPALRATALHVVEQAKAAARNTENAIQRLKLFKGFF